MKCKFCDGTGTSNTCVNGTFKPCTFCDGTGELDPNEVDRFNAVDVIKVMEMVKKPQTNEEWLEQASTEEKARFLEMICYSAWGDKNSRFKDMADYTDWMDWLKEKHYE